MADDRCESTAIRTMTVLGVAALLLPTAVPVAHAEDGWIRQDLESADRVGLVLDDGALRLDAEEVGGPAAPRRDPGSARSGLATFPEQPLEEATDVLDVRLQGEGTAEDVTAEARGTRSDGMWTEWHPVPDGGGRVILDAGVFEVQVRVKVDGADAAIDGVRLRPLEPLDAEPEQGDGSDEADETDGSDGGAENGEGDGDPENGEDSENGEGAGNDGDAENGEGEEGSVEEDVPDPPFSARLFATRIGLVGGTTANGHTVRPDDHFAALPSRRGLAARGGGEYTVRVCTTGALGPEGRGDTENHEPRCVYLPVWDVGPWNITDDHWNDDRQSWRDLDRGRPQAQAAYAEGYNDGLDGFGRRVANPAGIDLADGAFRHGLQLPTNGWVEVDYLWTGEYRARAEIATSTRSDPVIVRDGPGLEFDPVGLAAHAANVDVECRTAGDSATGPFGTDRAWYRIGADHYVPAVFADGGDQAPECAPGTAPPRP
ncbi:hypothetical protein [Nocardiopsis sp. NRRL B-16309]|uniref:hypothetical protein n=1 Tax=Nocardiopsis sp. NRRL B-16309 TaxID=1519494 RepID=UPI0006AF1956|nr:hypothetical protein [Nocardiopsis sp. NRRL B-16309]KOX18311.1 hypothetical protein ADL05_07640 [Nocardiopsis sp. NRRL B-16309]